MQKVQLDRISKSFPGVKALASVSLTINAGEIHSICGENGAGKSTLMNILTGNLQPDQGSIILDGSEVSIPGPSVAFDLGIGIVYQHPSLVDSLSVAENIYANQQPVNRFGFILFDKLYAKTSAVLRQLGVSNLNPSTSVAKLSPVEKQMVEIAKALSRNPSLLILDEPTASITEKETNVLFDILRMLKQKGIAILYISHRLEETFLLSDCVSILKDGTYQGTFSIKDITKEQLIARMVGRELTQLKSSSSATTTPILEVKSISGKRFKNISFSLRRGEILGLAGLIGAGRTEIARAIFGADQIDSGEIIMKNKNIRADHPSHAIREHIAYVPEERKHLGLFLEMSVKENVISADLMQAVVNKFYSDEKASRIAVSSKNELRIATPQVDQKVIHLSGGNQQKVVLAKWLLTNPDVLIVDEPTHGIDVGAKYEIYEIMKQLVASGKSILMISSDLPELIGICDRILVIKEGILSGEVSRGEATEEIIMSMAAN